MQYRTVDLSNSSSAVDLGPTPTVAQGADGGAAVTDGGQVVEPSASASMCWDEDVWGNTTEGALTMNMCRRSRRSVGNPTKLWTLLEKLESGHCITVGAIGGSVTCGAEAGGESVAWPQQFVNWLDVSFPCATGHRVKNVCQPGVATSYWVEQLQAGDLGLRDADLVVVDTAVNDGGICPSCVSTQTALAAVPEGEVLRAGDSTTRFTEVLVRMLRRRTSAALVWLTPSFHDSVRSLGPWPIAAVEAKHDAVARYYGIAYVSAVGALWPLESPAMGDWVSQHFFARIPGTERIGDLHPSPLGHKVVAQLLGHLIRTEFKHLGKQDIRARTAGHLTADVLPPPAYVTEQELRAFFNALIVAEVDCTTPNVLTEVQTSGWAVEEDVPGKPGLITRQPTANFTYLFHIDKPGYDVMVTLDMLKSYEHMGAFRAAVRDTETGKTVANATIDCLWSRRVSVHEFERLTFASIEPRARYPKAYELRVEPIVIEPTVVTLRPVAEAERKIKLLSLRVSAIAL
jgi:hypothetical protein